MRALAVVLISVFFISIRTAAAVDITACGQFVPDGDEGDLVASLDCTGSSSHCIDAPETACTTDADCAAAGALGAGCYRYAVRLGNRSTLRLNGFSIVGQVGGSPADRPFSGVICRGKNCVVDGGGGSIEQFQNNGIWHFGHGKLTVSNISFDEAGTAVVTAYFSKKLFVNDVTVHGGLGISARDIYGSNVNLIHEPLPFCESSPALYGRKIRGSNLTATSVSAEKRLEVTGLTVDGSPGCGDGVVVQSGLVVLTDSSITGAPRFDLVSRTRPRLVNTTCGSSRRIGPGNVVLETETWGVCAGD